MNATIRDCPECLVPFEAESFTLATADVIHHMQRDHLLSMTDISKMLTDQVREDWRRAAAGEAPAAAPLPDHGEVQEVCGQPHDVLGEELICERRPGHDDMLNGDPTDDRHWAHAKGENWYWKDKR